RNLERGHDSLPKADALEHRVDTETIGQFAHALNRLVTAFTHDLRSAKFLTERNPFRMTTEQDDPFRTQAARRDNAAKADRAVADDRTRPAWAGLRVESGAIASRRNTGLR